MFDWLKAELSPDPVEDQLTKLWEEHNRVCHLVREITELMKALSAATAKIREDLDFLGMQMVGMLEQQNKLASQLMRNEDLLSDDKIKSTRLH